MQSNFEGLEVHTAFPMVVMGLWSVCYLFLANEAATSVSIDIIIILINKCTCHTSSTGVKPRQGSTSQNAHSAHVWNNFTCSFPTVWGQFPNAPLKEALCHPVLSC